MEFIRLVIFWRTSPVNASLFFVVCTDHIALYFIYICHIPSHFSCFFCLFKNMISDLQNFTLVSVWCHGGQVSYSRVQTSNGMCVDCYCFTIIDTLGTCNNNFVRLLFSPTQYSYHLRHFERSAPLLFILFQDIISYWWGSPCRAQCAHLPLLIVI